MSNITESHKRVCTDLAQSIEKLGSLKVDEMVGISSPQKARLNDEQPMFEDMRSFFRRLTSAKLQLLAEPILADLLQKTREFESSCAQLIEFNLTQLHLTGVANRPQLVDHLFSNWSKCQEAFAGVLSLIELTDPMEHLAELLKKSEAAVSEAIGKVAKVTKSLESDRTEAQLAVKAIRDSAKESGVTQEAGRFSTARRWYNVEAGAWAVVALFFGGFASAYIFYFLVPSLSGVTVPAGERTDSVFQATWIELVKHAVPRVAFLSILFTGMVWAMRNYAAGRHNAVLNAHRADALSTFTVFCAGTADPRVKDTMLLHAASAAFTPLPTGFLRDEPSPPEAIKISQLLGGVEAK